MNLCRVMRLVAFGPCHVGFLLCKNEILNVRWRCRSSPLRRSPGDIGRKLRTDGDRGFFRRPPEGGGDGGSAGRLARLSSPEDSDVSVSVSGRRLPQRRSTMARQLLAADLATRLPVTRPAGSARHFPASCAPAPSRGRPFARRSRALRTRASSSPVRRRSACASSPRRRNPARSARYSHQVFSGSLVILESCRSSSGSSPLRQ